MVLLTAWLAWHYRLLGQKDDAERLLTWVEQQADEQGQLPEQVTIGIPSWWPSISKNGFRE